MALAEVVTDLQTKRTARPADPCVMVIFGAGGDLTGRKLIPALYNLAKANLLSREFAIVGLSHGDMSTEQFRQKVTSDVKRYAGGDVDADIVEWFCKRVYYISGEFDDKDVYPKLKDFLQKVDQEHTTHGNFFFYLATSPNFFGPIVEHLAEVGLMEENNQHWRRVIIEKPFARLGFGQAPKSATAKSRKGKANLPHRSLPWQRDCPEYFGLPICQRNL
jgi:glucose-6-phosphate 1-dehydrogenase